MQAGSGVHQVGRMLRRGRGPRLIYFEAYLCALTFSALLREIIASLVARGAAGTGRDGQPRLLGLGQPTARG